MDQETNLQINAVYKRFSTAYAYLDASGIASTYADNGVEVYLIANMPPAMIYGRDAIRDGIKNFFDHVRDRGHHLCVTFRIVNRELRGNRAFDTGFYHVVILDGEEAIRSQFGKVAIILQRNPEGTWEYLYDANGSATQDEYEKATPIPNGEIT